MEMPIALIILGHTKDLEILDDFAEKNEMEIDGCGVCGGRWVCQRLLFKTRGHARLFVSLGKYRCSMHPL